jgi:type I restriction enzyme M protein
MKGKVENLDPVLNKITGVDFSNVAPLTLTQVLDDPSKIAAHLKAYVRGFSEGARDVLDKFGFPVQIDRLAKADLLFLVLSRFCEIDLHPDAVSNVEMGYLYEELIRRFSELSNETAGEHFTPREVIRLMVELLFIDDDALLSKKGIVKTLFDPACGTGGMLSVAEERLRDFNSDATLEVFGQELNAETYAVCRSDMMLKGQHASNIKLGNSFTEDGHDGERFDYLLANPPFGVEWKKVADKIKAEHEQRGFDGRFGAGLPRINDGSFLFLQHMISKMKAPNDGGSRLAIVFNGSPLFTGGAGSGESEIRRWIIENDWLEAVVALPDQLFHNTGISTYVWIVTNRKKPEWRGTVHLVDARNLFVKMRKSLGEKRKEISRAQIAEIVRLYGERVEGERVKVFGNESFGFQRITVERPLRLRWEINSETLAVFESSKAFAKLAGDEQDRWRKAFTAEDGVSAAMPNDALSALTPIAGEPAKAVEEALRDALAVRDPEIDPVTDKKGNPEPDADLRDNENVPLPAMPLTFEADVRARFATTEYRTAVADYVAAEVLPYVADAWVDHDKTKIGYEIPLTRHFYEYVPPRPLEEIDAEIKMLETEIQDLLREVTE